MVYCRIKAVSFRRVIIIRFGAMGEQKVDQRAGIFFK